MANDSKGFYKLLDLSAGADISEVKKAYRKKQAQLHPNGPVRRQMKDSPEYQKMTDAQKAAKDKSLDDMISEINVAYSVIGDEEKKKDYDNGTGEYGGFNFNGGGGFGGFEDIFSAFGGRSRQRQTPKVSDTVTQVNISMEQAFTGKVSKFKVNTTRLCKKCNGLGYPATDKCGRCNGHGRVYMERNMGIMVTRQEVECDKCNGSGEIGKGPACVECKGHRIIRHPFTVEVNIKKGVSDGTAMRYPSQGNHEPNKTPGDLVFVIRVTPDSRYERVGNNIIAKVDVDLITVLTGGLVYFTHLDGRQLSILCPKLKNIKNSLVLYGEGFKGVNGSTNGNLYLNLNVIIPATIDKSALENIIPGKLNRPQGEYTKVNGAESSLPKSDNNQQQRGGHHYEEEDDDEPQQGFDASSFFRGGFSFF